MFKGAKILLVEDEESLAEGIAYNLNEEGYSVELVADGRGAMERFREESFDLVILDIMLPFIDGFEVARQIRSISQKQPILMLTARATAADRVQGLESGADDYLTKPFHLEELLLRVAGMIKRKSWYTSDEFAELQVSFGDVSIDFGDLTGTRGETEFTMTPLEATLIRYFIDHPDRIVSKEELLEHVWHVSGGTETRSVENFIVRVRRLIEADPKRPAHIVTVRGAGYLFHRESNT